MRTGSSRAHRARATLAVVCAIGAAALAGCSSVQNIALSPGGAEEQTASATPTESPAHRTLMDSIAERLLAGEEVAAYKSANALPISDPAREAEVIAAASASAVEQGIDADLAKRVVTDQIAASKIVQVGFQALWAAGTETPPADPSLDHARAAISAATATIVTELGDGATCPVPAADVTGISAKLQQVGLDAASSDRAARTATGSLCG